MGLFDFGSGGIGEAFATGGLYGEVHGEEFGNLMNDPLDLFGWRASKASQEIKGILIESAREGIAQMEKQEAYLREQYQPYYESGLGGLQDIETMATGGELEGYKPSKIFEYQKREGMENIDEQYEQSQEQMAVSGLLNSSAMEEVTGNMQEQKGELIGGLAAEEADRMYSGQLSRAQIGAGTAEALGAAGTATSGKIGGLYANLGNSLNQAQQAYGQNRQAAWGTAGNSLQNLSGYMEMNRG